MVSDVNVGDSMRALQQRSRAISELMLLPMAEYTCIVSANHNGLWLLSIGIATYMASMAMAVPHFG